MHVRCPSRRPALRSRVITNIVTIADAARLLPRLGWGCVTSDTRSGHCQLIVEDMPCPILAQTQHEALRITREALTNAVKHAAATEIVVELCYPDTPDGMVRLAIRDNGRTEQLITAKPGHYGLRNMIERARAVGGMLEFCRAMEGGTAVVFTFAPAPDATTRASVATI